MEAEAPTTDAPIIDARTAGSGSPRLTARQKLLSALALLVLAAVLLLTFAAYLTPEMLFDFGSLQLCS
jgi:hypothetical protein